MTVLPRSAAILFVLMTGLGGACGSHVARVAEPADPCPPASGHLETRAAAVTFDLDARTLRVAGGGWGVHVALTATATDGKKHKLETRPIHLAGSIAYAGGPSFATAEGAIDPAYTLAVGPGKPAHATRDFPTDPAYDDAGSIDDREFTARPGSTLILEVGPAGVEHAAAPDALGVIHEPALGVIQVVVPRLGCPTLVVSRDAPGTDAPPGEPAPSSRP